GLRWADQPPREGRPEGFAAVPNSPVQARLERPLPYEIRDDGKQKPNGESRSEPQSPAYQESKDSLSPGGIRGSGDDKPGAEQAQHYAGHHADAQSEQPCQIARHGALGLLDGGHRLPVRQEHRVREEDRLPPGSGGATCPITSRAAHDSAERSGGRDLRSCARGFYGTHQVDTCTDPGPSGL